MNIGYLLFMGLLCTTLVLWAIVAIRDDGQGVFEEEESAQEEATEESQSASSEGETVEDTAAFREEEHS
jgi:stringent starvation protein B